MSAFITSEDNNTSFRTSKLPPDYQFLPDTQFDWRVDTDIPTVEVWDESAAASGAWAETAGPVSEIWAQSPTASGAWTESSRPSTGGFEESD